MSVRTGVDEYNQPTSDINSGYIGEFKYFGFESVPPHCLACDGSEVSRETYNELYAVFGTTFGAGDGVSTFNLPDLRGAFLRCIGGNAAALGAEQGDAIRNITGTFSECAYQNQPSPDDVYLRCTGAFRTWTESTSNRTGVPISVQIVIANDGDGAYFDASLVVPTAAENRPVNVAVNICVVYE